MNPQYPLYIPSKGRADTRLTVRHLETMGVPFRVVVEAQEHAAYAAVIDPAKLLVLDPAYQRAYDTCDAEGDSFSKGSGPARNFIWDHAAATGAAWHWIMDDNIKGFFRLNRNLKVPVADGTVFRVMEDFVQRYQNVAMAGPDYFMFQPRRQACAPFTLNTRIFSCNLIRTDAPFRWRARYNEDTDLSLRMLKAKWCTILFNAFLQFKTTTMKMAGGNTSAFYAAKGTLPKSEMLVRLHPDVTRLAWKFNRWHHVVDYSGFQATPLVRREGVVIPPGVNDYGMRLRPAEARERAGKSAGRG